MVLQIPNNFEVRESIKDSDNFFDSVAQGLRQVHHNKTFTVKSLRNDCKVFAQNHIRDGNTWIIETFENHNMELEHYIECIAISFRDINSAEPITLRIENNVIWGRPAIEGRMLCAIHNIAIYVIDMYATEKTCLYESIDKSGCRTMDDIDYDAKDTIYLLNKSLPHFEPLLRKPVKQIYVTEQSAIKIDNDSRVTSDSSDDDDLIALNSKMTIIVNSRKQEHVKVKQIGELIHKGADINFRDANRKNDTPLHLAIRKRNFKVIEFLLENNANIHVKNSNKKSPLDLASDLQYMEIVDIFSKKLEKEKKNLQKSAKHNAADGGNSDNFKSKKNNNLQKHAFANKPMQETYKKRLGVTGAGGHFFEMNLLTLFKLRGDDQTENFYLAGNMDDAGAFDDIVFRFVEKDGNSQIVFLQAKHKEVASKENITYEKLKKEGDFYLNKYFQAFLGIKNKFSEKSNHPVFEGVFENLNCKFIMYTNAVLDNQFEISGTINANEEISSIMKAGNCGKALKLKPMSSCNDDIIAGLAENARLECLNSLVNSLLKFISLERCDNIMSDETIQIYHVFLAENVMEIDLGIKQDNEKQDIIDHKPKDDSEASEELFYKWKFRKDFLENNSKSAELSEFRNAIFKAYTENTLMSGQCKRSGFIIDNEMKSSCEKIAHLLDSSITRTIEIDSIADKNVMDIVCDLVGNVIVYIKENDVFKFTDEKYLDKQGTELVAEIKKHLTHNNVISKYTFMNTDFIIQAKLRRTSFSLPREFGNVRPKFKYPAAILCEEIVNLLRTYCTGNVCRVERIDYKYVKDIAKLVGNLFQLDEDSGLLTLADTVLDEEVQQILDMLKVAMNENNYDMQTVFDIQVRKFPSLSLGCSKGNENCAREFLKRFMICSGQPDECKLEELIIAELVDIYKLTPTEAKSSYKNLNYIMRKWWETKNDVKYLRKGDGFLNEIMRRDICFELKSPVKSFIGRTKELDELNNILHANENDGDTTTISHLACISGLAGIGKSELARKYAEKFGESYDGNVIWIDAESMETISTSFRNLCQDKLSISTRNVNGFEKSITSLVGDVYTFFGKRKSLFIFDNAQSSKTEHNSTEFILNNFLQLSNPHGSNRPYCIITSCYQSWPCRIIQLDTLTEDEAEEFVKYMLEIKNHRHNSEIKQLIRKLQHFPLALQHAVAYIRAKDKECKDLNAEYSIQEYLEFFEDKEGKREILNCEFPEGSPNMYKNTIFKTLKISIEKIEKSVNGTDAMQLLNIMAYLAPNEIPINLFQKMADKKESGIRSMINILKQYSLIRVHGGEANIHQLVQKVIQVKMQDHDMEKSIIRESLTVLQGNIQRTDTIAHGVMAWSHACKYNEIVCEFLSFPNTIIESFVTAVRYEDAKLFGDRELNFLNSVLGDIHLSSLSMKFSLSHVMYCQGKYEEALCSYRDVYEKQKDALGYEHNTVLRTLNSIADVQYKQGKLDAALQTYEEVLQKRTKMCGLDHPETLSTRNSIACIWHKQGRKDDALQAFTEILKKRQEILDIDHADTLITQKNLADVLTSQGKYDAALQSYEEVYEKEEQTLGPEHPNTLTTRNNIAHVLTRTGKDEKALAFYEDVLDKRGRVLGSNHPETLETEIRTAEQFSNQGKYDDALELFRNAVEISCTVWGVDDPQTFNLQHNIAEIQFRQGNYKDSILSYQKAMEKETQILGKDHETVFRTKFKIFEIFLNQGNYAAAKPLCREVIEMRAKLMKVSDHDTLKMQFSIADLLNSQSKYDKALEIYEEVYEAQIDILGPDHEDTVNIQKLIAEALYNLDEYVDALVSFKDTYEKQLVIFGADHRETLNTQYYIANVLNCLGRYEEALSAYNEVYDKHIRVLGCDHEDTINTHFDMADLLHRLDKYDEALQSYNELLTIQREFVGSEHEDTITALYNIANVKVSQGNYEDALIHYRDVNSIEKKILGFEHEDTLTTESNIADVLCELNRYDEALKCYEEIFAIQREFLGSEHKDTLTTQFNIANALDNLGRYEEALVHYRDVNYMEKKILGFEHEDTLTTVSNISAVLSELSRNDEALRSYEEIFTIQREFLGSEHKDTLTTQFNIANVLDNLGKSEEALIHYKDVNLTERKILGFDHEDTLFTKTTIANVLCNLCKFEDALQYYDEIFAIQREFLGSEHEDTLQTRYNIAHTLGKLGKFGDSLVISKEVHSAQCRLLSSAHPDTLKTLENIHILSLIELQY